MIEHELLEAERVLVVTPVEALEAGDFERLAADIDPFIEEHGGLAGLMIYTEAFPGWDDFAGLVAHLKFVKAHHEAIAKIALVTDASFGSIAPKIAQHFIGAEIRHFPYAERDAAMAWIRG